MCSHTGTGETGILNMTIHNTSGSSLPADSKRGPGTIPLVPIQPLLLKLMSLISIKKKNYFLSLAKSGCFVSSSSILFCNSLGIQWTDYLVPKGEESRHYMQFPLLLPLVNVIVRNRKALPSGSLTFKGMQNEPVEFGSSIFSYFF